MSLYNKYINDAENGNAHAQAIIGYLYGIGEGVVKDYHKAMEWSIKAATQGHKVAMYNIGVFYGNGNGVEKDVRVAENWYNSALEAGLRMAKDRIGELSEFKAKMIQHLTNINNKQGNIIQQQGNTIQQQGNTIQQQGHTIQQQTNQMYQYIFAGIIIALFFIFVWWKTKSTDAKKSKRRAFDKNLKVVNSYWKSLKYPSRKCFISYAWPVDGTHEQLQTRLLTLKQDLQKAGMEVKLDITNMAGPIEPFMDRNIADADRVILICTPRLKERAAQHQTPKNNLRKELDQALEKQAVNSDFIVPVLFEGDFDTSIPSEVRGILSISLLQDQYYQGMLRIAPKGLIPTLLNFDDDQHYNWIHSSFKEKLD